MNIAGRLAICASVLVINACGGSGGEQAPPPDSTAPQVEITADVAALRMGTVAKIEFALSESSPNFSVDNAMLDGGTLTNFTKVSDLLYTADFESSRSVGETIQISVAPGTFQDAAGNANGGQSSILLEVDPLPRLMYEPTLRPLTYTPDLSHSYYSPGAGTVNIAYTSFVPPTMHGEPFPSSFLVQVQLAKTLARISKTGVVEWTYPSAGRFVTATNSIILVNGLHDVKSLEVLDHRGRLKFVIPFDREVNYAKVEGNRLVVVYNSVAQAEVYAWNDVTGMGALLHKTATVSYSRAAVLDGDRIAIADTFGHRVIIQSLSTSEILATIPMTFPNDVSWEGDFVYAVEEHQDRVLAINSISKQQYVVMAPPTLWRWESLIPVGTEPAEYCGTGAPSPRSRSSDACSGTFTLYAPNGFAISQQGMYVADTDNARVIFVKDGEVVSVLKGFNNPVKIVEVADLR